MEQDTAPFFSPSFYLNGLEWRLKIYADAGPLSGKFLSVFLELTSCIYTEHPDIDFTPSEYNYQIHMISPCGSKELKREYSCKYAVGECWGYQRFYAVQKLKDEGFWNPEEDIMIFKFRVVNADGYVGYSQDMKK
jgi:tripartite motif-containing protein 37